MKIGQHVITPYGKGMIRKIEDFRNDYRVGVKHCVLPKELPKMYKDDIMYYFRKDVELVKKVK